MNLSVRDRNVVGMPTGSILLFLAEVETCRQKQLVAVFGLEATCIPKDEDGFAELFGGTIEIFNMQGVHRDTHIITHGHKYGRGGGMAEIDEHNSERGIAWQKAGIVKPGKRSQFMGETILPECIFVAL